ncbi:MAG: PAS domain S-box protein [Verrucomicrobiota bacterium]|nr:PAS domain S-box protein [Verrucomicrobiota bacterium]
MREQLLKDAKILIIDDEILVVDVLSRILEAQGYSNIEGLTDPREALDVFRSFQPDLIVLDLMMPRIGGLEVLEKLRAEIPFDSSLPILVVTADPSVEAPRQAFAGGASDFISKPFDPSQIVLRVRNLLVTRFLYLEIQKQNELLEVRVAERTRQLAAAQDDWEQSFNAIPDHVAILDISGKIVRANKTMRDRFEPIHGNLIGLDYRLCYCGTTTPNPQPPCAAVLSGSPPVNLEGTLPALAGWFSVSSYPLFDGAGKQSGAVSVVRDISARKEAEEALRESREELEHRVHARTHELELANSALSTATVIQRDVQHALELSETRLRVLYDENPLMLITTDAAGIIRSISRFGAQQLGYAVEELVGKPVALLYHEEDRPAGAYVLNDCLKHPGEREASELRKVRKDGSVLWARETARALPWEDDRLILILCEDITERKRMADALHESDARYQRIAANAPGMVYQFIWRPDRSIAFSYVGEGSRQLFGMPPAEIEADANAILSKIHPVDRAGFLRSSEETLSHLSDWNWERRFLPSFGEEIWIHGASRPERLPDGSVLWDGIFVDITARKKAEEAIRFHAHILNNIGEAVIATDPAGRILYVNARAEIVYGWTGNEMIGENVLELIAPKPSRQQGEEIMDKVRKGETWSGEFPVQRRDGTTFEALVTNTPLLDECSELIALIGISTDVTNRKRAERALRESEARFRQIAESIADVFWITSVEPHELLYVSPAYERVWGTSVEKLLTNPRHWMEAVVPEDRERVQSAADEAMSTGRLSVEYRIVRPDGVMRWINDRAFPVLDAEGKIHRLVGLAEDITERKHAQDALNRFFTLSLDLLATAGFDGRFKQLNPAWERTLGWTIEELCSRPFVEFLHPDDQERTAAEIARLSNGLEAIAFQDRYRCKDGSYKTLSWNARADVTLGVIYASARDVTRSNEIGEQLRRARDEAEGANRAKSEFLSRMSHELRTPLNAILGFGQLLENEGRDPEEVDSIQQILAAGRHLHDLINEVLDISGIEAGRLSLSIEPLHLGELVQETLSLVRPAAAAREVTLPEFFSELYVLADSQRFRQVLLNLLGNAIKYNKVGGRVMVAAEETTPGTLRVKIADTGAGISPDDQPKIFTAFERLGAPLIGIEGLGLGLAISKRLMEMMGGTIGVESTLGEGCTVWVELPLVASPGAKTPRTTVKDSTAPSRCTLLYIEDNLSNLKLVERIVARRPDIKLIAATRGELGLELAREHRPDLILLDLHLPDIDGEKVLEELMADPRTAKTPVMIVSADATPAQISKLKAAGARDYVTKPLDVQSFLDKVNRLVSVSGK